MGIFPIWGFQLAIAIALSFLLRLNKTLVIIAANISIFPPLIIFISHWVGGIWMGNNAQRITFSSEITLESIGKNFVQYVLGAITLSVIAGLFFGSVTLLLLKIFKRAKS